MSSDSEGEKSVVGAAKTAGTKPEGVVTFLSEKEERRVAAGKVYNEKAAAKKRERKQRYRARKALAAEQGGADGDDEAEGPLPQRSRLTLAEEEAAAARGVLAAVGGLDGAYDIAYGTGEGAVPDAFRSQFDAVLDRLADTADGADVPRTRAERAEQQAARAARRAERQARVRVAAGTADDHFEAAAAAAASSGSGAADGAEGAGAYVFDESDDDEASTTTGKDNHYSGGIGGDDEDDDDDDDEKAGTGKSLGGALAQILRARTKEGALAGEEKAVRAIREERAKLRAAAEKRELRRMILNKACVAPSVAGQGAERRLRLVATRGVVQLFNAIAQHQSEAAKQRRRDELAAPADELHEDISQEAVERGRRRAAADKVSQQRFLAILKGSGARAPARGTGASPAPGGKWDALSDNFMHNTRAGDWKKNAESGSEGEGDDGHDEK